MTKVIKPHALILTIFIWLLAICAAFAQTGSSVLTPPPGSELDQQSVYQVLSTGNVYVDPTLASEVDTSKLEQAALQGKPDGRPHTIVKIAVLQILPPEFLASVPRRDLAAARRYYAYRLHDALKLGKNGLVVVIATGKYRGVSVWADGLKPADRTRLERAAAPDIKSDPTGGTARLAQQVAADINAGEYTGAAILWIIFGLVVIIVGALIFSASRKKKQELAAMRAPLDALRENVLSGIEYLDGYVDVLPKNNPDSDQVRAYRQAASTKYDQAARIIDRATEASDLTRAQGLLDRSQADIQQARAYLDRTLGGTENIPGDDAMRPPPLPESQDAVAAIPQNQRGVSFFSSQPAPLGSLVPVTITINGESRQVLATPEEADEMRHGRMPQVRSFNVNGHYVPWYQYNQYDPYNDYWRYQNNGWGGFGGGILAGWIGAELLGGLFAPNYGVMPYAFATDMDYYRGYTDAQNMDWANAGGGYGGLGGDFNQDSGFNDQQGLADADAGNFVDFGGGDSSSGDYGGSDFGGGGDFGGGDSGSGDF